ncbi:MAG: pyridoxamine 5'-phosphate oxidase family protein [Oceanospirillaceae bacterium]|nr:pyridoxamine 5'-phosphate oxidase family protein [Oceanospirillaceae bacterium]
MNKNYIVSSEEDLEAIIGPPMDVKAKISSKLDDFMKEFIAKSPLLFVSTIDANGHVDVSPKGDPCGFVEIDADGNLLIPDRPGNRLVMGFRNIIRNGEIGLLFIAPNQKESLRVKGTATLTNDPIILNKMQVNNKPALLCTHVEVKECFMHCGKALVRSKLWQPEFWDNSKESIGVKQFASVFGGSSVDSVEKTKEGLDKAYSEALY